MREYHFSNAVDYTHAQLSEMHNRSFSGYFFPMELTPEASAYFWRVYQVDANRCVVMHDHAGAFVGMARMATRGKRGWCGGFGIVPEFRGSGASKILATQMVQVARDSGLTTLQLEALTQNSRAIKLYEKVGFTSRRRLFGLTLATDALPDATSDGISLQATTTTPDALLPWLPNVDKQYWGRELPTLLTLLTEAIIARGPDGQINGLLLQRFDGKIRIFATVLQSRLTNVDLAVLLRQAAANVTEIEVYNEPDDQPLLARYRDLGFNEFFSQYEMVLTL
jgi:ribosomal protein S18 acetylase RimI-like enzyme